MPAKYVNGDGFIVTPQDGDRIKIQCADGLTMTFPVVLIPDLVELLKHAYEDLTEDGRATRRFLDGLYKLRERRGR